MGVRSVLVEGGARVITSMLAQGLVDRLIVSVAPTLIGSGREAVGDLGVARMDEALHLADRQVHVVGDDLVISGDVQPARPALAAEAEAAGP